MSAPLNAYSYGSARGVMHFFGGSVGSVTPEWTRYHVQNADVVALGAVKTATMHLPILVPAGAVVCAVFIDVLAVDTALSDITISAGTGHGSYVDCIAALGADGHTLGWYAQSATGDIPNPVTATVETDVGLIFTTTDALNLAGAVAFEAYALVAVAYPISLL